MATCRIENLHFYGFCRFIIVCSFKSLLRDLWFCSLDIIVQMLFMNRYFFFGTPERGDCWSEWCFSKSEGPSPYTCMWWILLTGSLPVCNVEIIPQCSVDFAVLSVGIQLSSLLPLYFLFFFWFILVKPVLISYQSPPWFFVIN